MITKEKLIETIKSLPDKFSIEEVLERIIFLEKVEEGLQDSKSDRVIPHHEVVNKFIRNDH